MRNRQFPLAGLFDPVSMISKVELAQAIKAQARYLGFDLVGITTPETPVHFPVYENWLDAGRHGEMDYLASGRARQRRENPRCILPECKSILALGISYHHTLDKPDPPGSGWVAAFSMGRDYHEVLPQRLRSLVDFIEAQVGCPILQRTYTDTGPLLERELAQRAGLGWIGKNTCLISPRIGSYVLLAEILLGIDLPADLPFEPDLCGSCTRCLHACPTSCILPDRTLDARRCISYLTIELRGMIPVELRPAVGAWIFGCDICQQVCPWNQRFAPLHGDPDFAPRPNLPTPTLVDELALSPQEFNRKYKVSPVQRAKRRGYLRNVAVALGNAPLTEMQQPEVVAALSRVLQFETEPLVRGHAAWALGRIGGETARQSLIASLDGEADDLVRGEIRAALVL